MCYFVPIFGYISVMGDELALNKKRALQCTFVAIACVGVISVVISIIDIVKGT